MRKRKNTLIVLVTHKPAIAAYAARVVTFRAGQIVSNLHHPAARSAPVQPGEVQ